MFKYKSKDTSLRNQCILNSVEFDAVENMNVDLFRFVK